MNPRFCLVVLLLVGVSLNQAITPNPPAAPVTPVTPAAPVTPVNPAAPVTPVTPGSSDVVKQVGCVGRPDARCVRCLQDSSICAFCAEGYFPELGTCVIKNKAINCGTTPRKYCLTCEGEVCGKCLLGILPHKTFFD